MSFNTSDIKENDVKAAVETLRENGYSHEDVVEALKVIYENPTAMTDDHTAIRDIVVDAISNDATEGFWEAVIDESASEAEVDMDDFEPADEQNAFGETPEQSEPLVEAVSAVSLQTAQP